jgi:uncharacterized protein (TIRG00374 family)
LRYLKSFSFLFGPALLILILSRLNLRASWETLKTVDFRWFLPAFLFAVPEIFFKSERLKSFVTRASSHISLKNAAWAFLSGQPLAAVTPGKLGDVTRIILLNRLCRLPMPAALAVHAADRIYDLAAVLLLAIIGFISFLVGAQQQGPALAAILGMLAGMFLILIFLNPRWMKYLLKPLVMGLLSKKLADQLSHHGREFYDKLHTLLIPSFRIFGPFVLSFLAWETAILRAYFCAMALGLPLSFFKFALLAPVMIMVELLPISILGFGTREAAMFLLFTSDQLPRESLMAFSLLIVIAGPLFVSLAGIPAATQLLSVFKHPHEKTRL